MRHPPTSSASSLTRRTVGLTDAHLQLIHLLAEIAVQDYVRETESADIADEPVMDRREATR